MQVIRILDGIVDSSAQLAGLRDPLDVLRPTLLAPEIVKTILDGGQGEGV